MICCAYQRAGFYVIGKSVMKESNLQENLRSITSLKYELVETSVNIEKLST